MQWTYYWRYRLNNAELTERWEQPLMVINKSHIELWHGLWHSCTMKAEKKITVHVPEELLRNAQKQTHEGISATIRQGLRLVAAGETYKRMRELRGKVAIQVDLDALRQDR
jgi:hypothetical protein